MYRKTLLKIIVDKLPTSTGDRRISEPSTAMLSLPNIRSFSVPSWHFHGPGLKNIDLWWKMILGFFIFFAIFRFLSPLIFQEAMSIPPPPKGLKKDVQPSESPDFLRPASCIYDESYEGTALMQGSSKFFGWETGGMWRTSWYLEDFERWFPTGLGKTLRLGNTLVTLNFYESWRFVNAVVLVVQN